jgi:alkylation response protein AidB-like acyl-CoA dehydrogenase
MLLAEEHEIYQREIRRFMRDVVKPLSDRYPYDRHLSRDEIDEIGDYLKGYVIATTEPTKDDGSTDLIAASIFIEELARVDCSLTALTPLLFFNALPMEHLLDDNQRKLYGHLFARGKIVVMGLSEPEIGSDPSGLQSSAHRSEDGWVINARKLWTTNGQVSDAAFVACRLPEQDGKIALFLVDRANYEYQARPIPMLGWHRVGECETVFENCLVPDSAMIGEPGQGLSRMLSLVDRARINIAFTAVGVAQAAYDVAVSYAKEREQFGRPIASFQLVQEMIVDMAMEIEAARMMAMRAAVLADLKLPTRVAVSMAKAWCTEAAGRVTDKAVQVLGGMGLTAEAGVERMFRDARVLTIPDGTTQIHKLTIGRELLGISALR